MLYTTLILPLLVLFSLGVRIGAAPANASETTPIKQFEGIVLSLVNDTLSAISLEVPPCKKEKCVDGGPRTYRTSMKKLANYIDKQSLILRDIGSKISGIPSRISYDEVVSTLTDWLLIMASHFVKDPELVAAASQPAIQGLPVDTSVCIFLLEMQHAMIGAPVTLDSFQTVFTDGALWDFFTSAFPATYAIVTGAGPPRFCSFETVTE